MAMARARAEDADERLAREKVETEQSLRQLRARRERFEAALAARGSVAETRRIGKSQGQIDVEDARSTAFAEAAALEALRQRRARIDARIAALLGECHPERKDASDDVSASASAIARAARAAAAVDAEYVVPQWKQRRDRRLAEEAAAAAASGADGRIDAGRDATEDAGDEKKNVGAALVAAARLILTRRGDAEGLRDFLLSSSHRGTPLRENIDAHLQCSSAPKDGDDDDTFEGFTLLTLACVRGDWPAARCLLRFGADVNARDRRELGHDGGMRDGFIKVDGGRASGFDLVDELLPPHDVRARGARLVRVLALREHAHAHGLPRAVRQVRRAPHNHVRALGVHPQAHRDVDRLGRGCRAHEAVGLPGFCGSHDRLYLSDRRRLDLGR